MKRNDISLVNSLNDIKLFNEDGKELMKFTNNDSFNISAKRICKILRTKYDGKLYLNMVLNGPPVFNLIIEIRDKINDDEILEEYNDIFINSSIPENRILHNVGILMMTKDDDIFDASNVIDHHYIYHGDKLYKKNGFHPLSFYEHHENLPLLITTLNFESKKIDNLFNIIN